MSSWWRSSVRRSNACFRGSLQAFQGRHVLRTGRLEVIKADLQPALMSRLTLYEGEVMIRLHLYEDPSDTYIHNHSANFFSYCLAGSYAALLHSFLVIFEPLRSTRPSW